MPQLLRHDTRPAPQHDILPALAMHCSQPQGGQAQAETKACHPIGSGSSPPRMSEGLHLVQAISLQTLGQQCIGLRASQPPDFLAFAAFAVSLQQRPLDPGDGSPKRLEYL